MLSRDVDPAMLSRDDDPLDAQGYAVAAVVAARKLQADISRELAEDERWLTEAVLAEQRALEQRSVHAARARLNAGSARWLQEMYAKITSVRTRRARLNSAVEQAVAQAVDDAKKAQRALDDAKARHLEELRPPPVIIPADCEPASRESNRATRYSSPPARLGHAAKHDAQPLGVRNQSYEYRTSQHLAASAAAAAARAAVHAHRSAYAPIARPQQRPSEWQPRHDHAAHRFLAHAHDRKQAWR